ncbi:hypothetical protein D3C85_1771960 [compost metagenome]
MFDHQIAVLEEFLAQGRHAFAGHLDVRQRRNEAVEAGKIADHGPDLGGIGRYFHRRHDSVAFRVFDQGIGLQSAHGIAPFWLR